ncbi:peptidoglycan/xylan/chitin deacetylase (PgdA/CDA1 family) [Deinococcus metalli]|uniref:Peptidoglycan/xylan/chitin deacetylase (PgdA/CDA1 family) n=1 Tax=Deinococcus metalli TaxID=1141878 RepID=A0A7W8NQT7_9DEIO|nr:polysaccharide deacetylase family protein [Deinococcus metalli]MBB5378216.1 peptidoglycan/xylan/chitin deacetylase (PgdA/CDA1 family) [Deinococcus metalli]GHF56900.1 polysaccharide deacetylase familiy protein [Deinococcus metalli]
MNARRAALGALAGLVAGYVGVPYVLAQWANLGVLRAGPQSRRALALTFDDGPDPVTTPAVLDALRGAQAHATFFVFAGRAEAQPALIARMLAEGHQVEAHAVKHVHAWWRSPWGAWRDPGDAARRIAAVTGRPVTLHRPPHGAYTLATWLGQRRAGLTGAHWSVEGGEWAAHATPDAVRAGLLRRVTPGAVVVLHDAGPGARVTVPMLPELLDDLRARGYALTTLRDLPGLRPGTPADVRRRAFAALDRMFDRVGGIRPLGDRADTLFRVARIPFPLDGVHLDDGPAVPRGTPAVEFHVNNTLLVDQGAARSMVQGARDLALLARDLRTRPEYADVQVVYCLSALWPLMARHGFHTVALPPATTARLRLWANILRLGHGSPPHARPPQLSIMTRGAFLHRFG